MPKVEISLLQIPARFTKIKGKPGASFASQDTEASPRTESKVLDTVPVENESQSASSDGGSILRSPFLPQMGGTRSFGAVSSELYTPGQGSKTLKKQPGEIKEQKQRQRELEKIAAPEKQLTVFAMRLAVGEDCEWSRDFGFHLGYCCNFRWICNYDDGGRFFGL